MNTCSFDGNKLIEDESDCILYAQLLDMPIITEHAPQFPNGCYIFNDDADGTNQQKVFYNTPESRIPQNPTRVHYKEFNPLLNDAFDKNSPLSEICKNSQLPQLPSFANNMLKKPPAKYIDENGNEKIWNGKKFCNQFNSAQSNECCEYHVNKTWSECYRKKIFSSNSKKNSNNAIVNTTTNKTNDKTNMTDTKKTEETEKLNENHFSYDELEQFPIIFKITM